MRNDDQISMTTSHLLLDHFDHLLATPEAVERLNQTILDLAVRGKLVPQDPTDEPASELLKRHFQRLESDEAADSSAGVFQFSLPSNWSAESLGRIALQITKGATPTTYGFQYQDEGVRFIKVENINNGHIILDSVKHFISDEANRAQLRSQLQVGDVLFSIAGTIGATCIVKDDDLPANINQALAIIRGTSTVFEPRFLKLQLDSFVANAVRDRARGGAMNNVSLGDLRSFLVAVPPLAEQHRIVARVEQLFAQTRQLAALLSKAQTGLTHLNAATLHHLLAADTPEDFNARWDFIAAHFDLLYSKPEHIAPLRQAILELAVRGKLTRQDSGDEPASELLERVFAEHRENWERELRVKGKDLSKTKYVAPDLPEVGNLPQISVGWSWVYLDTIAVKITDGEHFRPTTAPDGVYFLSAKDIRDEGVSLDEPLFISETDAAQFRKRCDPDRGDVLVVSRGATVGRICLVDIDDLFCLLGSVILIKPSKLLSNRYIACALKSPDIQRRLFSLSGATAQQAIYIRDIRRVVLPLPPYAEQQRIVARVEQLLGLCDALEAKLQAAQTQREKLAGAVVAGVAAG